MCCLLLVVIEVISDKEVPGARVAESREIEENEHNHISRCFLKLVCEVAEGIRVC